MKDWRVASQVYHLLHKHHSDDLNKVEINELPVTRNERIQPLQNIFTMANESIGETKDVSLPHLVRIDDENMIKKLWDHFRSIICPS